MSTSAQRELPRYIAGLALFAGVYFLTARIGLSLNAVSGFATFVWPPTGIALAVLLIYGYRFWPSIMIAAFAVNFVDGAPLLAALGIGIGNTLEAVIGAWLLVRVSGGHFSFGKLRNTASFIVIATIGAPVIAATIATASLWSAGAISASAIEGVWQAWWIGDMLGALIATPFLMAWLTGPKIRPLNNIDALAEAAALVATIIAADGVVFFGGWTTIAPLLWILLLPLLWATFRFGARGATSAVLLLAAISIISLLTTHTVFSRPTLAAGLFQLQFFIGSIAGTMLVFVAVIEEWRGEIAENKRLLAQAERAVALRDEFISIASHELRTPLTSLRLYAELMDKNAKRDQSSLAPMLPKMHGQLGRLTKLIEDLLDISKIELGRLSLVKKEFDLDALVRETAENMSAGSASHSIVISGALNRPIFGDQDRIEQVLQNILGNAIKYSPEADTIEVTVTGDDAAATISVQDFGIGIGDAHLPNIFERFYRASDEKGRTFPGLGVGLYLSSEIVRRHGGRIDVTSGSRGSIFSIRLPWQAA